MNNYEFVTRMLETFLVKGTYIKFDGIEDSIEYITKSSIANVTLRFFDEDNTDGPFYFAITNTNGKTFESVEIGACTLDENFNLVTSEGGALMEIEDKWFDKSVGFQVTETSIPLQILLHFLIFNSSEKFN